MFSKFLVVGGNPTWLASLLGQIQDCLINLEYKGDLFEQIMKNQTSYKGALSISKAKMKVHLPHMETSVLLPGMKH